MLTDFLITQIEKGINAYLALDPEAKKNLAALDNKTISLHLAKLNLDFQLHFKGERVYFSPGETRPADVRVSGTPINLFFLTLSSDRKQGFFGEDISIEGDAELGQEIISLFDQLEIDWEEYLAQGIGDLPAHQLGRFAKGLKSWGQQAKESFCNNLRDYVQEEKPWFPPAEALQDFFTEVDETRMACDRLEERIKKFTIPGMTGEDR